jgi:RND family efflux transporter MFP subunit
MTIRSLGAPFAVLLVPALGISLCTLLIGHASSGRKASLGSVMKFSASRAGATSERLQPAHSALEQQAIEQYVAVAFAQQSADVVARSEGRLEEVCVNLGDHLKPGDVIARLEFSSVAQQLMRANAAARSAQAEERDAEIELADAEARYTRRKVLAEAGVLSKEELEAAQVQVARAESRVEAKEAHRAEQMVEIRLAEESLHNTVIRAPFLGDVAARYVDSGATVHTGSPIVSLIKPNDLWVRFAVPKAKQASVNIGSMASFLVESSNLPIPAVIGHVSPGVAAASQELIVEAKLQIPSASHESIRPGESGHVSLAASTWSDSRISDH